MKTYHVKGLRGATGIKLAVAISTLMGSGVAIGISQATNASASSVQTVTFWNAYNDVT